MSLTGLPTDNLYKFISLSGLTMVVLSVVLPYQAERNLGKEIHEVTSQSASLKAELEVFELWWVSTDSSLHEAVVSGEVMQGLVGKYPWVGTGAWTQSAADSANSVLHRYWEEKGGLAAGEIELVRRHEELEQATGRLGVLSNELAQLKWYGRIGLVVGLFLAAVGFVLWYTRLQRYLDAAARESGSG